MCGSWPLFPPGSEPPSCGESPSSSRNTASRTWPLSWCIGLQIECTVVQAGYTGLQASRTLPLGSSSALLLAARASACMVKRSETGALGGISERLQGCTGRRHLR